MTMENESVEDVFPIEHFGFSNFMLDFRGVVVWEYKLYSSGIRNICNGMKLGTLVFPYPNPVFHHRDPPGPTQGREHTLGAAIGVNNLSGVPSTFKGFQRFSQKGH